MSSSIRLTAASESARWALRQNPASTLAIHWGVSVTRARHRRTDDIESAALTEVLAMVANPKLDGAAKVTAVLEALEGRYLEEAKADRPALEAKLARLTDALPDVDAKEQRARMKQSGVNNALRNSARARIEILAIRMALGMEEG